MNLSDLIMMSHDDFKLVSLENIILALYNSVEIVFVNSLRSYWQKCSKKCQYLAPRLLITNSLFFVNNSSSYKVISRR